LDRLDHSVWTNTEELQFRPAAETGPRYRCPRCQGGLESISPSDAPDLAVERCASCHGFWLDAGELDKIEDAAMRADAALEARMHRYRKPPDWSVLRWLVYCYKTFK
jgi:Zn-finger nucleic acid-binding protein